MSRWTPVFNHHAVFLTFVTVVRSAIDIMDLRNCRNRGELADWAMFASALGEIAHEDG